MGLPYRALLRSPALVVAYRDYGTAVKLGILRDRRGTSSSREVREGGAGDRVVVVFRRILFVCFTPGPYSVPPRLPEAIAAGFILILLYGFSYICRNPSSRGVLHEPDIPAQQQPSHARGRLTLSEAELDTVACKTLRGPAGGVRGVVSGEAGGGRMRQDSCAVCLEDFMEGQELRVLKCGHEFHSGPLSLQLKIRKVSAQFLHPPGFATRTAGAVLALENSIARTARFCNSWETLDSKVEGAGSRCGSNWQR
ncbi:hypothetical protein BDK51DRAFT_27661 [Blyttiomyces helicus]|uniref:RING-type domain-containing protein n=1 Tax=Blyttiomyces helicus TaxID=388810 RepID=A0A4P9W444_9FUNG|nr:hypothetical protein BDK51DRAFT_27661 [Blyttiomyces helicus]|eukprot:RKO86642.1 hypothetical protein BDK51DRAFT_27661 [Blyttiomyces helicus]